MPVSQALEKMYPHPNPPEPPQAITMPNLLRTLGGATNLTGFSKGWKPQSTSDIGCQGHTADDVCRLNAAVDGADVERAMKQVDYLVAQIEHSYSTLATAWKVATVFVGLGDAVFHQVNDSAPHTPTPKEQYRSAFRALLNAIRLRIGHVFVNVMLLPEHISAAKPLIDSRPLCAAFNFLDHKAGWIKGINWTPVSMWDAAIREFNEVLTEEVALAQQNATSDFHVVLQPFMRRFTPTDDLVEHFDCFHPNERTSAAMATSLWNSMVTSTPKAPNVNMSVVAACPTNATRLH